MLVKGACQANPSVRGCNITAYACLTIKPCLPLLVDCTGSFIRMAAYVS